MAKSKTYRALTGLNFINSSTGEENRVEPGDKIEGLSVKAAESELAAGNIEEWVAGHTENVPSGEELFEGTEVHGVRSRRKGGDTITNTVI